MKISIKILAITIVAAFLSLASIAGADELSKEDLMERGKAVYTANCIACHQLTGQGIPPVFPSLVGSAVVLGPVAAQIDLVLNGRAGTTMQAFGVLLSDEDIAAVINYTRNSWANADKEKEGEDATVAAVAAARN